MRAAFSAMPPLWLMTMAPPTSWTKMPRTFPTFDSGVHISSSSRSVTSSPRTKAVRNHRRSVAAETMSPPAEVNEVQQHEHSRFMTGPGRRSAPDPHFVPIHKRIRAAASLSRQTHPRQRTRALMSAASTLDSHDSKVIWLYLHVERADDGHPDFLPDREVWLSETDCTEYCCGVLAAQIRRDEAAGQVLLEVKATRISSEPARSARTPGTLRLPQRRRGLMEVRPFDHAVVPVAP
jgi:hypothetical protein